MTPWLPEIRANAIRCEAVRSRMKKPEQTGTISEAGCVVLRDLVARVQPRVCAEIGTFIGTSALVLASSGATVYTCDKDNDPPFTEPRVICHPKTRSTVMLAGLIRQGVKVDLFFFDGRIQPDDVQLIVGLSHRQTVYAFDDYEGQEKGVLNAAIVASLAPDYVLTTPAGRVEGAEGVSRIAWMEPRQ